MKKDRQQYLKEWKEKNPDYNKNWELQNKEYRKQYKKEWRLKKIKENWLKK